MADCEGGFEIIDDAPCRHCGATDRDICGVVAGTTYVTKPPDSTCYVERTRVREIITSVSDEHVHVTEGLLADIDSLPIFTATDFSRR